MARNNQTKNPCGKSQDSYFLLDVVLDVHLMALEDGMIICGKSSAFYSQTACCLIDSSSAWMNMGVPRRAYRLHN